MHPTSSLVQLAFCLSSLTPLAVAWPGWLFPHRDSIIERHVVRREFIALPQETGLLRARQNNDGDRKGATETDKSVKTTDLNTAKEQTGTETDQTGTATDSAETGTITGTETAKKKGSSKTGKKSSKSTRTSYGNTIYPAGISVTEPATTFQPTPLFKIGEYATFGWNYTSLKANPTAVDVLVSCSNAANTWTLTSNMTFETSVEFVWDTRKDRDSVESPLGNDMYTLIVKDSEAAVSDPAQPGYLGAVQGLTFGMYQPQPYTPLSEWRCIGCSVASGLDHHAIAFATTMSIITLASFTWFATGFGLQ